MKWKDKDKRCKKISNQPEEEEQRKENEIRSKRYHAMTNTAKFVYFNSKVTVNPSNVPVGFSSRH